MATDFSTKNCTQLLAYAKGGVRDAVAAGCPSAKAKYQAVVNSISARGGCSASGLNEVIDLMPWRGALSQADTACGAEAKANKSTSTAGRVVQPEVKPVGPAPAVVDTSIPPAAQAGFSPWLLVGGLGVLVLLFGKKGKK